MNSIFHAFANTKVLLTATLFGCLEIAFLPKPILIFLLGAAVGVDLLTGMLKSWNSGNITTSTGLKKTVTKLGLYAGVTTAAIILANQLNQMHATDNYAVIVNLTIGMMTFIELYSVFENVYEISPNSPLSRYVAKPFLTFLKGRQEALKNQLNKPDDAARDSPEKTG